MRNSILLVVVVLALFTGCPKEEAAAPAAPKATAASSAGKAPPPFKGSFKEAAAVIRTCKEPCARDAATAIASYKGEPPTGPALFAIKGCASLCQLKGAR